MGTNLSTLSVKEVSEAVGSHGAKYDNYAVAIEENGVDGDILSDITVTGSQELKEVFDELEITSKLHRKVLTKALSKAKKDEKEHQKKKREEEERKMAEELKAIAQRAEEERKRQGELEAKAQREEEEKKREQELLAKAKVQQEEEDKKRALEEKKRALELLAQKKRELELLAKAQKEEEERKKKEELVAQGKNDEEEDNVSVSKRMMRIFTKRGEAEPKKKDISKEFLVSSQNDDDTSFNVKLTKVLSWGSKKEEEEAKKEREEELGCEQHLAATTQKDEEEDNNSTNNKMLTQGLSWGSKKDEEGHKKKQREQEEKKSGQELLPTAIKDEEVDNSIRVSLDKMLTKSVSWAQEPEDKETRSTSTSNSNSKEKKKSEKKRSKKKSKKIRLSWSKKNKDKEKSEEVVPPGAQKDEKERRKKKKSSSEQIATAGEKKKKQSNDGTQGYTDNIQGTAMEERDDPVPRISGSRSGTDGTQGRTAAEEERREEPLPPNNTGGSPQMPSRTVISPPAPSEKAPVSEKAPAVAAGSAVDGDGSTQTIPASNNSKPSAPQYHIKTPIGEVKDIDRIIKDVLQHAEKTRTVLRDCYKPR